MAQNRTKHNMSPCLEAAVLTLCFQPKYSLQPSGQEHIHVAPLSVWQVLSACKLTMLEITWLAARWLQGIFGLKTWCECTPQYGDMLGFSSVVFAGLLELEPLKSLS